MPDQKKAYLFALLSVLFWSTVATAFKIALQSVDFLNLLMYATLVSVIVLFVTLIVQKKVRLLFTLTPKDYLQSALAGMLNPFLYYVVLFKAYSILPAQIAQPLNYTWPVILVLLSMIVLKQKINLLSVVAVLISFTGVMVISLQGNISGFHIENPLGVGLAIGSSLLWASFWIINMKDKRDDVLKLFLNFFAGLIFIVIAVLLFSKIIIPDLRGLLAVTYVGLFEMGFTFILWLMALQYSKTTDKVSNLVFLSPFLSLLFIHFILGEKIFFTTVAGLILIIGGIVVQKVKK